MHKYSDNIRSSQKVHKNISTHLLTVLINGVIVQLEQRKGEQISNRSSRNKNLKKWHYCQ